MSDPKMQLVITATNETQAAFNSLTQALQQTKGNFAQLNQSSKDAGSSVKSTWLEMTTAFAAGGVISQGISIIINKIRVLEETLKESVLLAARVETLGVAMGVVGNNAGYTSAQMDAFEKQVKKMGITTESARASLTMIAAAQMDVSKAADMARVAQDAAVIGGINSSEAFQRMTYGIRAGELEVLRTIGINVNFENSYKKTADQLGITTNMLTDHQKVIARQNAVLEYGVNIQGVYEESMTSTGKKITSLSRYYDELKLSFGEAFSPALGALIDMTMEKLKTMLSWFEENKTALGEFAKNLADITKAVSHPFTSSWKLIKEPWSKNYYDEAGMQDQAENDQQTKSEDERDRTLKEMARMDRMATARKAQEAEARKRLAEQAAAAEITQYNSFVTAFNDKIRAIETADPALTAHEKELMKIHDDYEKLIEQYPKEAAALKQLERYHIQETTARQASSDAATVRLQVEKAEIEMQKEESDYIQKLIKDRKALTDVIALQVEIDLASVNAQEKFNKISVGEAVQQRIALLQKSISLLQDQYNLENEQGPQGDLKRLQLLQKVRTENEKLIEQQKVLYDATPIGGLTNALVKYSTMATNIGSQLENTVSTLFNGMETAMVRFSTTGKLNFKDLADSIISDLIRIQIRASISGLSNTLIDLVGMFTGGGTIANYNPNTVYAGSTPGPWAVAKLHDGGLVPRFHFGGLASDEFPAILQSGERVLDREHNAMMERFANKTEGVKPMNIRFDIKNETGVPSVAEQKSIKFDTDEMVVGIVLRRMDTDPSFRWAMRGPA
jgi:lambda family phage tail tape measure protein